MAPESWTGPAPTPAPYGRAQFDNNGKVDPFGYGTAPERANVNGEHRYTIIIIKYKYQGS